MILIFNLIKMDIKVFLLNLLLGVLGIVFYSMWSSKRFLIDEKTEKWQFVKFFNENYRKWLVIFLMLLICNIVAIVSPETLLKLTEITGLGLIDVGPGGFFTLAVLLQVAMKK